MLDPFPTAPHIRTPIGRLLHQISWEHAANAYYREGGRSIENILTTEVIQALDFLPREPFLAEIVRSFKGGAEVARAELVQEIESARLLILPGTTYLRPSLQNHSRSIGVQPDVLIETPGVFAFVEAKRCRSPCSFQTEQLAREYATVTREARRRRPLLLLLLPDDPPVLVQGQGRKDVREAIVDNLSSVLEKFEGDDAGFDTLCGNIGATVAWITWHDIRRIVIQQAEPFASGVASVDRAVRRLAAATVEAIDWHA